MRGPSREKRISEHENMQNCLDIWRNIATLSGPTGADKPLKERRLIFRQDALTNP